MAAQPSVDVPTYSQERPGTFVDMPDSALWQHVGYSDSTAIVGLRRPGRNRGVYRGRLLMDESEWVQSRHAVASQPGVTLLAADTLLPTVKVRFNSFEAFMQVRRLPMTDYVEPLRAIGDIAPHAEGVGGCNGGEWGEERLYTAEGDVYSVKHQAMGIDKAWLRTGGAGVNIGLVDTGIHEGQQQLLPASLGGYFNTGQSAGRSIKYRNAWSGQADVATSDYCGHGTEMSAVIAAPRDGRSNVGVAWQSNYVSVRHANGVVNVNSDDAQSGIREAAWAMDSQSGGKVIVMPWQSVNWWWQVSNEIDWWQSRRPDDLIFFGAAGTSGADWVECTAGAGAGAVIGAILGSAVAILSPQTAAIIWVWAAWGAGAGGVAGCTLPDNAYVVFPANHPHVVAVTCLDYSIGNISNNCHYGSKVEFGAYQRFPSVFGSSPAVDKLSGSSGAVAVVAGQSALVWSKYPWMTRDQVLDRMRWAGRSVKDPHAGWGIVNAYKAVGGMYGGSIASDQVLYRWPVVDEVTLTASFAGGDGPFAYLWSNGATTPSTVITAQYFDTQGPGTIRARISASVTITDLSDGGKLHAGFGHNFTEPPEGCPDCVTDPP